MSRMKVYISRKGEPVEEAVEKRDVEMVRLYNNLFGTPIMQLAFKGNMRLTLEAERFDFWIVPQDANNETAKEAEK